MKKESALIVARCSTNENKQDVQRQVQELEAKYSNQFDIVEVKAYYKSGTKNQQDNTDILGLVQEKQIQNIIVSEISRISRRVVNVLQFVEQTNERGVNVIIDNYNLQTLNKDKTVNVMVQTMLSIGATFASMELQLTQQRLNSGRAMYIKEGGKLGRTKGTKETPQQYLAKHKDVVRYLKAGKSIRDTMGRTKKSTGTVQKVKKILATS